MKTKILSGIIVLATFYIAIYRIVENSADIVLHWDLCGNITSYGSKYLLIILPLISLGLTFLFTQYEKRPDKMNHFFKYKDSNLNQKMMKSYIQITTVIIMLLLLYITICSAQYLDLESIIVILPILLIIGLYCYTRCKIEK